MVTETKLTRLLSIGDRGCAFAELSEEQTKQIELDTWNALMPKEHRSDKQLLAARKGEWQDCLYYDSRSYVSSRKKTNSFWIGKLETALTKGLVKEATFTLRDNGKQVTVQGYVRGEFDAAKSEDQYFAVNTELGRIETRAVRHGEKRREGEQKNSLFMVDLVKIEVPESH